MGNTNTKWIIRRITNAEQLIAATVVASTGSIRALKETQLPLPVLENTLTYCLPLGNFLDGSLRIWHSSYTIWQTYTSDMDDANKKVIYYKNILELFSAAVKIYFSYEDVFLILTKGTDIAFSAATTAFCLALTSFIDLMRSIWDMYQIMEQSKNANKHDDFIKAQWEMAFSVLRIIGWVCLVYGSPLGWIALSLSCAKQWYNLAEKAYHCEWVKCCLFKPDTLEQSEENAISDPPEKKAKLHKELHTPAYSWR